MGLKRQARQARGFGKAKARAERANQAAEIAQAKGEKAGHGTKLTRADVKAAKKKDKEENG